MSNHNLKYKDIATQLRDEVKSGSLKPGDKLPSEPELAATYQVSRETLRKSIALLCAEGLLKRLHGKGTFVQAPTAEVQHKKIIKVIVASDSIIRQGLPELGRLLRDHGYEMLFAVGHLDTLAEQLKMDRDFGVCGYIFWLFWEGRIGEGESLTYLKQLTELRDRKIPFVVMEQLPHKYKFDAVFCDNFRGGYLATESLIQKGHRKIAYLSLPFHKENKSRQDGYSTALDDHNLGWQAIQPIRDWYDDYGYSDAIHLLKTRQPDAVFCFNDNIAVQVLWAAQELGLKVPQDLALIGFDDINDLIMAPIKLSSINQNLDEISKQTVDILLKRLKGKWADFPIRCSVSPYAVERHSTAGTIGKDIPLSIAT